MLSDFWCESVLRSYLITYEAFSMLRLNQGKISFPYFSELIFIWILNRSWPHDPCRLILQLESRKGKRKQQLQEGHDLDLAEELVKQQQERDALNEKLSRDVEGTALKNSLKVNIVMIFFFTLHFYWISTEGIYLYNLFDSFVCFYIEFFLSFIHSKPCLSLVHTVLYHCVL